MVEQISKAQRSFQRESAALTLQERLAETRELSLKLAAPLSVEDMAVQAMEEASPTKWHLGHTTWFFETLILAEHVSGYALFDDSFGYCFNSYYERLGARQPRPKRGLLTRPSIDRVLAYRRYVDEALQDWLARDPGPPPALSNLLEIGINHEQQHQELILTDILSLFAANPLRPAYRPSQRSPCAKEAGAVMWIEFRGGVQSIGHDGNGFAWDNETPRHDVLVYPFKLADRLVTNSEWLDFIEDRGYETATLWLSDGWATVNREAWRAPLYWERIDGGWFAMTLEGLKPIERAAPVVHISYYEADAFARWVGKRLPTEHEWEVAATEAPIVGNDLTSDALRPLPAEESRRCGLRQMFGDVWEWTGSAYSPYPGYRTPEGALGEYNGKFMANQQVLRGGSCATPRGHIRSSYRNFFYPWQRWQFMGLRLASEAV